MNTICLPLNYFLSIIFVFIILILFHNKKNDLINLMTLKKINELKKSKIKEPKIIKIEQPIKQIIKQPIKSSSKPTDILMDRDKDVINDNLYPPERRISRNIYSDVNVKKLLNIPTRGLPDNYQLVGILFRKNDEKILQLYGRQKYPRSNKWEYYLMNNSNGFQTKTPLKIKSDREIEDKEIITVPWANDNQNQFEVKLYDYNTIKYNPYI